MALQKPELDFEYHDLEPHLDGREVRLHYLKHTQAYFDTANELIKGTIYEGKELDQLISKDTMVRMGTKLFNNVCQAYNHSFYWNCLTPADKSGKPSDELLEQIKDDFETFDKFKKTFIETGVNHFGSGWVWLYFRNNKLHIKGSPNAGNPLTTAEQTPLLTCDVWEHAYSYDINHIADKKSYVHAFWNVINWEFVNNNFAALKKGK